MITSSSAARARAVRTRTEILLAGTDAAPQIEPPPGIADVSFSSDIGGDCFSRDHLLAARIACDTDLYHNFSISTRMTLAWSDLRGGGGAETCIHHFKRTSSTQAIKCSADLQMCGSFDGTVLFTATMRE